MKARLFIATFTFILIAGTMSIGCHDHDGYYRTSTGLYYDDYYYYDYYGYITYDPYGYYDPYVYYYGPYYDPYYGIDFYYDPYYDDYFYYDNYYGTYFYYEYWGPNEHVTIYW